MAVRSRDEGMDQAVEAWAEVAVTDSSDPDRASGGFCLRPDVGQARGSTHRCPPRPPRTRPGYNIGEVRGHGSYGDRWVGLRGGCRLPSPRSPTMLKKARTNALLAPLAALIAGEVGHGGVAGVYQGYRVEALPRTGSPLQRVPSGAAVRPAGYVDMLRVTLDGVVGNARWCCQSSASSLLQEAASQFTAGRPLRGFKPGEFTFELVDSSRKATDKLAETVTKALGAPSEGPPDVELQQRLIAAGLFEELSALRWGPQPHLPKAEFTPPGGQLAHFQMQSPEFARAEPRLKERLQAAGFADYESLVNERMKKMDESEPGRLVLDVEMGKQRVPSPERFRELLDHGVRIAHINAEANPPVDPRPTPG